MSSANLSQGGDIADRRSGQAAIEYFLVAAVLITMVAILSLLLYTFREHSGRVIDLVASDYP